MQASAFRRWPVAGAYSPEQTTRLTGGSDYQKGFLYMKNKDMRRVARKFWRENWFTIFLSYIAGLLGFVLLTMLFSSLLNPFILFTGDFSLGELRRGIGLSLTGILFALYVFVCIFYFIVLRKVIFV